MAELAPDQATDALRVEYRRHLLRLASRDLAHHLGVDDAAAELADLAAGTLDAALALARAQVGSASGQCRLAVIAMGKCGGHELNYVSDVDVIFVGEPVDGGDDQTALRVATQLASAMMRSARRTPPRAPSGRSTPTCGPKASRVRWSARWPVTAATTSGGPRRGSSRRCSRRVRSRATSSSAQQYVELVGPMVWSASQREGFVEEVQAMRRRVIEHIPASHRRAADQARLRGSARRRVRRPAAPARARPHRRAGARADDAQRPVAADRGWLRRP